MHTICPTNQTILLSQLHLARIINYEAPSWAFLHHFIASYLFRQTTALLFFFLRCNNSILCSVSSRPSYRRGRQWYSVFTLWSLNEGQKRPSVGEGLIKKLRNTDRKNPARGKRFSLHQKPYTLFLGLIHPPIQWIPGFVPGGVILTIQLHIVPRLGMGPVIPPLPYILSWHGHYFTFVLRLTERFKFASLKIPT